MNLRQALRLNRNAQVALVGAGGKTTALFQLAREFEPPVLVTTSTHLGEWQVQFADRHWIVTRAEDVDRFAGQIEGVTLFSGPPAGNERLGGLAADALQAVREMSTQLGFPVLIEADGSRQKPLKAPGEHEPAIPGWVQQVIVVAGLSGLGKALDEKTVHRAERFAELGGLRTGDAISEAALARVLSSPEGGLKGIVPGARVSLLLNQADRPELVGAGLRIANKVNGVYHSVLVTSLSEKMVWSAMEPAAGIVLAAGGASRFGQPKQLLPWRGKPLVRHAVEAALDGGLAPVLVVVGEAGEAIEQALQGLPVQFVANPDWSAGQSSSLRMGINALPENCGSAIFLLADQPFVSADLISRLIDRHRQTLGPVVAPRVGQQRSNPVLFDRETFTDLLNLTGDTGGRAVLERFSVEYIPWEDERLLYDIDTQEDYKRLKEME